MTSMRTCLILAAALALGACGFHLRNEIAIPPGLERVSVEVADVYSPLGRDLKAALRRAGATVTEPGDGVGAVRVPVNAISTEVLTVGGTARVQEFVVRYKIELEVVDAAGKVLIAREPISLDRDFSFDETQALGAAAEQELIRQELQKDMVQQILRRIESIAQH